MQVSTGALLLAFALQNPGISPRIDGAGDWDILIEVQPRSGRTILSVTSSGTIVQLTKSGDPILIATTAHSCAGKALLIRVDQQETILLGEQGRRNVDSAFKQMLAGTTATIAYHPRPCESAEYAEVNLEGFAQTVEQLLNLPSEEIDALASSILEEMEESRRAAEEGTSRNSLGRALTAAARDGDIVRIIALLAQGAEVDTRTETNGYTPLIWAASRGHAETVRLLLSAGARANIQSNDGQTALMRACDNGRVEIAAVLVGAGADVNLATENGVTALKLATLMDHPEIIELLLQAGAINQ